jgi:NAD(P)-dependent dehydrogenase (short-subunit alcohol dehydrogenase family)
MTDFKAKNIVISGCTSGIGKELADILDKDGANLTLIARNANRLSEVIDNMQFPLRHSAIILDLKEVEGIKAAASLFPSEIHGFVHAAGVASLVPLRSMSYNRMDEIMRVNFYSFLEIVKIISAKKKLGANFLTSVVAISSLASSSGAKGQTLYAASKSSLEAASVSLSKEFVQKAIRFNTIKPGLVLTEMTYHWMQKAGYKDVKNIEKLQLNGPASVNDVANFAKFILSDTSRHLVGTSINFDGGGPSTALD